MNYTVGCLGTHLLKKDGNVPEDCQLKALFSENTSAIFQKPLKESNLIKIKEGKKREKIPTGKKKFKKWKEEQLQKQLQQKQQKQGERMEDTDITEDVSAEEQNTKKKKRKKKDSDKAEEVADEPADEAGGKKKKKKNKKRKKQKISEEGGGGTSKNKDEEEQSEEDFTIQPEKKKEKKRRLPSDGTKAQAENIESVATKDTKQQREGSSASDEEVAEARNPEGSTQENGEVDADKDKRTIFVGNIPTQVKLKRLRSTFRECGTIESVRMRSVAIKGTAVDEAGNQKLVKKICIHRSEFGEEKNSYNAYIVFKAEESVQKALSINNQVLEGHHLRVDRVDNQNRDPSRTVFLGNLNFSITEEEVRSHITNHFEEDATVVESVRIIRDAETQLGKGFGYVLLKDRASVASALKLDGCKLKGRRIRVRVCGKRLKTQNPPKQPSFQGRKTADGALRRIRGKFKQRGLEPVASLLQKKKKGRNPTTKKNDQDRYPAKQTNSKQFEKIKEYKGKKKRTPEQIARRMQKKLNKKQMFQLKPRISKV